MAAHFCPENKDLGALWLDMGMHEKQHAGLLQFCIAEGLFASPLPEEPEIQRVDDMFASLTKRAVDKYFTISKASSLRIEETAGE